MKWVLHDQYAEEHSFSLGENKLVRGGFWSFAKYTSSEGPHFVIFKARACSIGDGWILMDKKNSKYFGPFETEALAEAIADMMA